MKQYAGMLALLTFSPFALAEIIVPQMVLDKILFQISAKQWVTTHTALLNVNINVTLSKADLVKARSEMMTSLNKIAKGEWHLLQFDRSQDSSGLEKVYVQAQVRVDQADLTNIYQNAKAVSIPGAKYEVSGVDFKPSLEETQVVRTKVREQLYSQVKDEISRMNKVYPNQNYSINNLVFVEGGDSIPQPRAYQAKEMNTMVLAGAPPAPLTVSNELVITAVVEAASNRESSAKASSGGTKTTAENINSAESASNGVEPADDLSLNSAEITAKQAEATSKISAVILNPITAASNLIEAASRIQGK